MAKIRKAKEYKEATLPFFDFTRPCETCNGLGEIPNGLRRFECTGCNGSGQTGLKWITETDIENKIVSFTIINNGVPKLFKVIKGNILESFKLAEIYFSKLKI